jgi:transcriptional regulator with XRE-family HTH domain
VVAVTSPQEIGDVIRSHRLALGLTQAALAGRAEVSRKWLGEVEGGHPRAELGLVSRLLDELGLMLSARPVDPGHVDQNSLTVPRLAAILKDEIVRGDTGFALRLIGRALDECERSGVDQRRSFMAEPSGTADLRWDTLIAAAFRRLCRVKGWSAPDWTRVGPLPTWWFPVPDPLLVPRTMQRTPVDFSNLGIWLDPKALSVA